MWKTFQNKGELYMIKIAEGEILEIHLTDLKEIWVQNISKESLLNQFQEINPLFDVKCDEAVSEVVGLVNRISDIVDLEIIKSEEILQLILRSTKSNFNIQFIFNFDKASLEVFLKEITVPLIQTVKHMEDQQKMLCNIIQKKDREIEEYKLEKGTISRDDLITEKFDESIVNNIDDKSMLNVFGSSQVFWDTFVHHHGNIKATVENIEKDPWNHIKRKRKIYSSTTGIKKGKVLDDIKETESDERELILPTKSKSLYENAYRDYRMWCTKENINITTEDSIMTYFNSELGSYKSSTLWTKYSMLRSTINLNEGVDISKFPSLIPYLKEKGEGHKPKQSLTLTKENVDNFLKQASNKEHLLNKVVLIFGVSGACGRQELVSLETTNVEDHETHFLVRLTETETKTERSFIIVPGNLENLNLLDIIRKYRALRSPKTPHNRFFVNYLREKCTVQPVGVHKIASVPSIVAKFLNLENSSAYTSHCFRRTSASIVANAGLSNVTGCII